MTFFSQARRTCGTTHFIRPCTILHATGFGLPPYFEDCFPFQPFNRHPLITSGSVSPELVLTLPAYKMSRWHVLHYASKVEDVGVVSNDLLAGLWLLVVCGLDGRHISLVVPMKHDTWSSNDVVLVQLVQVLVLLVR